ncbi:hypothetical protein GCM10010191_57370 [Actinomadura vinacea]|uniref:Uncharacterized protein n=1 Tax=Actinomadura vinacea TaxID=115336 RepID=A0ABN3JN34_9ACTN
MPTSTPAPVGWTNPPLPDGAEVWTPSTGDAVIIGSEVKANGYVYYRCTGAAEPISGMTVYRRRAVVPAPPADPAPPSRSAATGAGPVGPDGREPRHAVHPDASAPDPLQQEEKRTPAFLRRQRERARERVFGMDLSNRPTVTPPLFSRDHRFKDLARLIVNGYGVTDDGLSFQVTVLSDLTHVAVPHDLIPVTLEAPGGRGLDTVIILTPPPDQNVCTFSASYTWNQLAKLLGLERPEGVPVRAAVVEALPQAGIRAEWWDAKTGPNAPAYFSGGIEQKNGSGRIDLRPVTADDLKASERRAKTAWAVGEPLRASRPVYRAFGDLLRPGMEMATALEAESEFFISGEQHVSVVAKLRALYSRPEELKSLGVELMSAEDVRRCTDTYYDIPELALLRRAIVLRRRRISSAEAGDFLLAVKGRTVARDGEPGERIRLASQVHLAEPVVPARLREFLADGGVDNAFARILADGLGNRPDLAEPRGWEGLAPRLVVTAQRVRYSFELAHSTTVDLSADTATGTDPLTGRSRTVHTVEFGISHAGMFTDHGTSAEPPPLAAGSGTANGTGGAAGRVLVTRPYHVPTDLDAPELFAKRDYLQYRDLRDRMMHHLFGYAAKDLALGGTKSHTLARLLDLV